MVSKTYCELLGLYSYRSSGTILNCGLHSCPQRCHQLSDHSKIHCKYILQEKCSKGHLRSWRCHEPQRGCNKCEAEARRKEKELQRAREMEKKRALDEQEHSERMAKLDNLLAEERERLREAQLSKERALAVQQKEMDLADAQSMTITPFDPLSHAQSRVSGGSTTTKPFPVSAEVQSTSSKTLRQQTSAQANLTVKARPTSSMNPVEKSSVSGSPSAPDWTHKRQSPAKEEWQRQKEMDNSRNKDIDTLMDLIGLEEVKLQVLRIKAKIEVSMRQNASTSKDRLHVSFLGNPGTGKVFDLLSSCTGNSGSH